MYRSRLCSLFLLSLVVGLTACSRTSKLPSSGVIPEAVEAPKYKLRLVFDGLVTLWEPNKTESPGEMWVFMVNASQPSLLPIGRNLRPHRAELLVQDGVQTSGRTLKEVTPNSTSHPHIDSDQRWFATPLDSEELVIKANTSTPLVVARDKARIPEPCNSKKNECSQDVEAEQKKDLLWAVDLDELLSKIPSNPNRVLNVKRCLRTPRYSCRGSIPLLATRIHLKNGRVFVKELEIDGDSYVKYRFKSVPEYSFRALAREIAVEIDVQGPVELGSIPLGSKDRQNGALVISGKEGQVVEVRVGNHPTIDDKTAEAMKLSRDDFLFTYNLFDELGRVELPNPTGIQPGQNFGSGQCSPNNSTGG